jgi:hypothetical protein
MGGGFWKFFPAVRGGRGRRTCAVHETRSKCMHHVRGAPAAEVVRPAPVPLNQCH